MNTEGESLRIPNMRDNTESLQTPNYANPTYSDKSRQGKSSHNTTDDETARFVRVRTGCFCCRKRKKKCDETQPHCMACIRNRIKCKYPDHPNETLPPNFELIETSYNEIPGRPNKRRRVEPGEDFSRRQGIFNVVIKKRLGAKSENTKTPRESTFQLKITKENHLKTEPLDIGKVEDPNRINDFEVHNQRRKSGVHNQIRKSGSDNDYDINAKGFNNDFIGMNYNNRVSGHHIQTDNDRTKEVSGVQVEQADSSLLNNVFDLNNVTFEHQIQSNNAMDDHIQHELTTGLDSGGIFVSSDFQEEHDHENSSIQKLPYDHNAFDTEKADFEPVVAVDCSLPTEDAIPSLDESMGPSTVLALEGPCTDDLGSSDTKVTELPLEQAESHLALESSLLLFSKYVPNLSLSSQDAELYHYFRSNFIPSITLPHSHPLLSPEYIWVNLASQSNILTQVNLFCGASFLAYSHLRDNQDLYLKFNLIAQKKYHQIVKSLADITKEEDIDSDWLLAAGLTLCLCDRSYGADAGKCAKHLIFVYNLINRREEKLRSIEGARIESIDGDEIVESQPTMAVTPNERSLIDSFIFNYSVTLFTCEYSDLINLPLPYSMFPKIKKWLNVPIYTDVSVLWVNNPVMGSALEGFEIMLKLIWMLRFHFRSDSAGDPKWYIDNKTFWRVMPSIKESINGARARIESNKAQLQTSYKPHPKITYSALRSNLAVATMLLDASTILYEKLANPSIPAFLPVIQEAVESSLSEFVDNIPTENHSHCMLTLSLFIVGICTQTRVQQGKLITKLIDVSHTLASNIGKNLIDTLSSHWRQEEAEEIQFGDRGFKCFDLIFDRQNIELIVF